DAVNRDIHWTVASASWTRSSPLHRSMVTNETRSAHAIKSVSTNAAGAYFTVGALSGTTEPASAAARTRAGARTASRPQAGYAATVRAQSMPLPGDRTGTGAAGAPPRPPRTSAPARVAATNPPDASTLASDVMDPGPVWRVRVTPSAHSTSRQSRRALLVRSPATTMPSPRCRIRPTDVLNPSYRSTSSALRRSKTPTILLVPEAAR